MSENTLMQLHSSFNEIQAMCDSIEDSGEEIPEELLDEKNEIEVMKADKVDRIGAFVNFTKSKIQFYDDEIKVLQDAKNKSKKDLERLKKYLKYALEMFGVDKLEGNKGHKVSKRKSQTVNIIDESKIGVLYCDLVRQVRKADIKQDLKDGKEVKGAELVDNINIVIK